MAIWAVFLFPTLLLAREAALGFSAIEGNSCPFGWKPFGSRCFKFFNTEQEWADAEVHQKTVRKKDARLTIWVQCLTYNGNLASVHSSGENAFVQTLIKIYTVSPTRAWLGGYDAVKEETWLWSDGTKMNYNNWGPDQPSNYKGKENCLEINYGDTQQWNDDACDVRKAFVCVRN